MNVTSSPTHPANPVPNTSRDSLHRNLSPIPRPVERGIPFRLHGTMKSESDAARRRHLQDPPITAFLDVLVRPPHIPHLTKGNQHPEYTVPTPCHQSRWLHGLPLAPKSTNSGLCSAERSIDQSESTRHCKSAAFESKWPTPSILQS